MRMSFLLSGLAAVAFVLPAQAAGIADQVTVVDPYVRLAPPGAKATGAFMVFKNNGDVASALVNASSTVSNATELHNHINDNGVMRMRQVKEIALPAKGEAALKPGGYHVMLIDMKAPLKEDDKVAITFGFADGSSKVVEVPVRKAMATMPMMKH